MFQALSVANQAREQLIFSVLKGKEIRITHYNRYLLKREEANLFVKGLGSEETNLTFYNAFKKFGEIFSVKLIQNDQGKSLGYGFVQYVRQEDAEKAIESMNGKDYAGKKLTVEKYKSRSSRKPTYRNLYIKNLPPTITTKEQLDSLFSSYGEISSSYIQAKEFKGASNYFAFVCFTESEAASKACAELNGKVIDGAALYVTKALTKEQRQKEYQRELIEAKLAARKSTLHVRTVTGQPLTEKLIREELGTIAPIKQITIPTMANGNTKEIGFVVYHNSDGLHKVIREYSNKNVLIINKLEGKEERMTRIKNLRIQQLDYSANPNLIMAHSYPIHRTNAKTVPMMNYGYGTMNSTHSNIPHHRMKREEGLDTEKQYFGDQLYYKVLNLTSRYFYCSFLGRMHQR